MWLAIQPSVPSFSNFIWVAATGDWSVGTNWSLGHEPTSSENAQVPDLTGAQTISDPVTQVGGLREGTAGQGRRRDGR